MVREERGQVRSTRVADEAGEEQLRHRGGEVGSPLHQVGSLLRRPEEERQRVVRRRSRGATRGRAEAAVTGEEAGAVLARGGGEAARPEDERMWPDRRRSGGGVGSRRSSGGSGLRRSGADTAQGGVGMFCRRKNGAKIAVKRNERTRGIGDPNFFPCFS
ncbi:hypothetical protein PR202_ga22040 [Eleusine coracana subsp. coracana]|uniref:Uncharacterized protein n=1 Tax=Eleusine coracana subsp. coracana TaxID=191504 RepID=A0AAV5D203_ELECO|nr:hypothetical protein PR202_ga22040 [Eleusine coracana subsp. coracana]